MGKKYWITGVWSNIRFQILASLDTSVGNVNPSELVYL